VTARQLIAAGTSKPNGLCLLPSLEGAIQTLRRNESTHPTSHRDSASGGSLTATESVTSAERVAGTIMFGTRGVFRP
jgi:hypothetical protein